MSDTAQQTPNQEVLERLAEHAPARLIPFLIGLGDYRQTVALKQQKHRDDYARDKKILGDMTGGELPSVEPEDMGDITVAGDTTTTNHFHYTMPETKPSALSKGAAAAAKYVLPALMAGVLGAGGTWLLSQWGSKPIAPVVDTDTDTDTNTQYVVEAMEGE